MPQMAPISWLILFIVFSLTFLLFNMLNFYCFFYKNNNNKKNNNENKMINKNLLLNWKW